MKEDHFTFHFETRIPAPLEEVFAWHEKPGAFERLTPPFLNMQVISANSSLEKGECVHFRATYLKSFVVDSVHEITHSKKNDAFIDQQIRGPFAFWKHLHKFRRQDDNHTIIEEIIHYKLPLDHLLSHLLNNKIAKKLTQIFRYRQQILKNDILFLRNYPKKKLHILMTGSSGLVGSALKPLLKTMGHHITPIQRHLKPDQEGIFWDIENQKLDPDLLENSDAVIHLAGENIAGLWTPEKKEKIYNSRIDSTKLLVSALQKCKNPPKAFICASGINRYKMGPPASENGEDGEGFLFDVIKDWEEEAQMLHKTRVALIRTGVVLSPRGGMLKKLIAPYRFGLGFKIGNGQNYLSWISIQDLTYLYAHILMTDSIEGPINATSPFPISQKSFSKTLSKTLKRPRLLSVPSAFFEAIGGSMARETLLSDLKVYPEKIQQGDFKFSQAKLELALRGMLGLL